MLSDYLRPEAAEFVEWCLAQDLRFWAELACQAIGAIYTAVRGAIWGYRGIWRWAILSCLLPALAWSYRLVVPPRDPILDELRTCLAREDAVFTPADRILQAEPLACQMCYDTNRLRYTLSTANLANRDVTAALLGPRNWARFTAWVEGRVARLEAARVQADLAWLREQTHQREAEKARQIEAERLAMLQALANHRSLPA